MALLARNATTFGIELGGRVRSAVKGVALLHSNVLLEPLVNGSDVAEQDGEEVSGNAEKDERNQSVSEDEILCVVVDDEVRAQQQVGSHEEDAPLVEDHLATNKVVLEWLEVPEVTHNEA